MVELSQEGSLLRLAPSLAETQADPEAPSDEPPLSEGEAVSDDPFELPLLPSEGEAVSDDPLELPLPLPLSDGLGESVDADDD